MAHWNDCVNTANERSQHATVGTSTDYVDCNYSETKSHAAEGFLGVFVGSSFQLTVDDCNLFICGDVFVDHRAKNKP